MLLGLLSAASEAGLLPPAVALAFGRVSEAPSVSPNRIQTRVEAGTHPSIPRRRHGKGAGFISQQLAGFPFSATSCCQEGPRVLGTFREASTDPPLYLGCGKKEEDGQGCLPFPPLLGLVFRFRLDFCG